MTDEKEQTKKQYKNKTNKYFIAFIEYFMDD